MLNKITLIFFLSVFTTYAFASKNPQVLITTNKGNIELQLNAEKAPKTVENFLLYVKNGFYTGTVFIASSKTL